MCCNINMARKFINNERFIRDSVTYYGRIPFATFGLKSELSLLQGTVSITDVFDLKPTTEVIWLGKASAVQASRFGMKTRKQNTKASKKT